MNHKKLFLKFAKKVVISTDFQTDLINAGATRVQRGRKKQ